MDRNLPLGSALLANDGGRVGPPVLRARAAFAHIGLLGRSLIKIGHGEPKFGSFPLDLVPASQLASQRSRLAKLRESGRLGSGFGELFFVGHFGAVVVPVASQLISAQKQAPTAISLVPLRGRLSKLTRKICERVLKPTGQQLLTAT